MSLKVEDVKNTIKANEEIVKGLKNSLGVLEEKFYEGLEELSFKVNNKSFALIKILSCDWIDDGKYDYCTDEYQLASYEESITPYLSETSITGYYNIIVEQDVSRTGSYYSEWTYIHDKPIVKEAYLKTVPKVVIPEHEQVRYKEV